MTVPFGGEELRVVVTTCEEVCKTECDKFLQEGAEEGKELLLGVDCEWFPNVSRFLPSPLAVLQLCFGKTVLVIQLLGMAKFPECVADLFQRRFFLFSFLFSFFFFLFSFFFFLSPSFPLLPTNLLHPSQQCHPYWLWSCQ